MRRLGRRVRPPSSIKLVTVAGAPHPAPAYDLGVIRPDRRLQTGRPGGQVRVGRTPKENPTTRTFNIARSPSEGRARSRSSRGCNRPSSRSLSVA